MRKNLYMLVTNDEFEFPIYIADSAQELADMVGTTRNNIYSCISHAKEKGFRCQYVKVPLDAPA